MRSAIIDLVFFATAGLWSCSPVLYSTVGQNVPLFQERGEAAVTASFASSDNGEGVAVQAAVAAGEHWALMTSLLQLVIVVTPIKINSSPLVMLRKLP